MGWFLRKLKYVIVDEAHGYRGVFGAHVSLLMRRLRRVCRYYGATPVFIGASATSAEPAESFARLIGSRPTAVTAVTESTAPRGATHVPCGSRSLPIRLRSMTSFRPRQR